MLGSKSLDISKYGPVFASFIQTDRLNSLGSGQPDLSKREKLQALDLEEAFSPQKIVVIEYAKSCFAALYLQYDLLDESHQISQAIGNSTGSYWHAIVHRREGDYWNSKYWVRQVGQHPVYKDLATEAMFLYSQSNKNTSAAFLGQQSNWEAEKFVDLCESCSGSGSELENLCRKIQRSEWFLLFDYAFRKALAA